VEIRISVSISVLFLSMKGGGREFKLAGQRPAQVGFTFVGRVALCNQALACDCIKVRPASRASRRTAQPRRT